jgi:mRNA-degrading endonuclease toxin of MazEF toxin-antitoxin module
MEAAQSLNELFVILATTTVRGLPTEVELGPEDGMPRSCVLNDDHASAADKAFLTERITRLGSERMSENLSCARLRDELLSATPAPQNRVPKYVPK